MNIPNPDNYVKLFNIKEEILSCFNEVVQRESMEIDGFHKIEVIYIDGQWFFNKNDLKHYDFEDEKIKEVLDLVISRGEKLLELSQNVGSNFSNVNDTELFETFNKLIQKLAEYMRIVDVPVYASTFFEGKTLKKMYDLGFSGHDFDVLTHPQFNTFHQKRRKDLALLKKGEISKKEFVNEWNWSEMVLFKKKFVDDEFIDDQLSHIEDADKVIKELDNNHKKAEKEFKELYEKLSAELKIKADLIQNFLYVRDYRFELYIKTAFNSLPIMDEVAKRLGITYEELIFMTPDELKERKVPSDIDARIEGYVFFKGEIFTGDDVKKWKEVFNKKHDVDFVEGKGVSKGKVKGIAKIALSADEAHKIEKGDIIICDITTPDYMHALHKVSAIVANIGGFTSHSAIVSREFGIPCVVGTGNATSVFVDGDLIEVDADKGIARKIK